MAPLISAVATQARNILSSTITSRNHALRAASARLSQVGPLAVRAAMLVVRETSNDDDKKNDDKSKDPQALDPSLGVTEPKDINNTFIFVLFGLIGAGFVVTGIWFFFWAKNGGFYFRENDWDDYKSTVLRRRGPNGTILSGATESTDLGGGSVYKDVVDGHGDRRRTDFDARTEYTGGLTEMTGVTHDTSDTVSTLTGITAGASDIMGRERRRRAREKKEREHREKRKSRGSKSNTGAGGRRVGQDGVLVDEEAEEDAKRNLRAYRHERPARVGGLNGEFEGSEWDGSTNPATSTVSGGSESLLAGKQATPTREKSKSSKAYRDEERRMREEEREKKKTTGGIRKVYSTADRTANRENERLRNEARRAAATGPSSSRSYGYDEESSAPRRNYSFQRATAGPRSTVSTSVVSSGTTGTGISDSVISEETDSMITASERDHHPNPYSSGQHQRTHGGRKYLPAISSVAESEDVDPAPPYYQETEAEPEESDLGTKSYRHYIPGLSSSVPPVDEEESNVGGASDYIEEQRRKRGAQRYTRR